MEDNKIEIILDDGSKKVYDVLLTFDSDNTNKSYVVYTDYSPDENNCLKVYASSYVMINDKLKLEDIDTEYEINYVNDFLADIQSEVTYVLDSIEVS